MRVFRILGNEGTITIPCELRQQIGFSPGDVVSFEAVSSCAVLVRREQLLDGIPDTGTEPLKEFLESLSPVEQFAALVHLNDLWSKNQSGKPAGGTVYE